MMMKPNSLFVLALLMLSLVYCKPRTQSTDTPSAADSVALPGDSSAMDASGATARDTTVTTLTETYWRLVELTGKPVPPTPADQREIHVKFRETGNVEGFGGCNGFGGSFEMKAGDRIKIGSIIRTQMACPRLEIENELIRALETADNFNLDGKRLVLNRARMAPLARFEAVYFN